LHITYVAGQTMAAVTRKYSELFGYFPFFL